MKDVKELKDPIPIYEPSYEGLLAGSSLIELAEILSDFVFYNKNVEIFKFYGPIMLYMYKAKKFNFLFFRTENPRLKRLFCRSPLELRHPLKCRNPSNIDFLRYIRDQYNENIKILENEFHNLSYTNFLRDILEIINLIERILLHERY